MKKAFLLIAGFISIMTLAHGQEVMDLYDGPVPGAKAAQNQEYVENNEVHHKVSEPKLILYPAGPDKANGTAIIICPGGGYEGLWMVHEGASVAKKMNALGITAFVLKYRMPDDRTMNDKRFGPLQDAERAIQKVRENAARWHVNPGRVGVIGFSAGGHLASTLGTHFDTAVVANPKNISLRPDFMILIYPVISFADSVTHMGSRNALIGRDPSEKMIEYFSNNLRVSDSTPPALLIQATDDKLVSVKNSLLFYQALLRHHVSAAMHLFDIGGHGFPDDPAKSHWFDYAADWLRFKQWVK